MMWSIKGGKYQQMQAWGDVYLWFSTIKIIFGTQSGYFQVEGQ